MRVVFDIAGLAVEDEIAAVNGRAAGQPATAAYLAATRAQEAKKGDLQPVATG